MRTKHEKGLEAIPPVTHLIAQDRQNVHLTASLFYVLFYSEEKGHEAATASGYRHLAVCGTTIILLWALYIRTLHPSLPGGDSGKFASQHAV